MNCVTKIILPNAYLNAQLINSGFATNVGGDIKQKLGRMIFSMTGILYNYGFEHLAKKRGTLTQVIANNAKKKNTITIKS